MPRQLTSGPWDHGGPLSWTPDSRAIVFSANRHADAEHALGEAMSLFNLGYMAIVARAATEELYWAIGSGNHQHRGFES